MGMHAYLGNLSGTVTGRAFFHKFKPTALRTRPAGNDIVSRGQTLSAVAIAYKCHARLGMAYHLCIPGMQEGSDTCVD